MTHRQWRLWQKWYGLQWNRPDRTDNYLMQIAAEIRRVLHKRPNSVKMAKFKLKFETNAAPSKTALEISQRRWLAFVGLKYPGDEDKGNKSDHIEDSGDTSKEELLTKYQERQRSDSDYQRAIDRQHGVPSPRNLDGGDID